MSDFKTFLQEDYGYGKPWVGDSRTPDIDNEIVRNTMNVDLYRITGRLFLTPYIALNEISNYLSKHHIHLTRAILDGEHGFETWPIRQFGQVSGMTDKGTVETKPASDYSVYFEYAVSETGWFVVFCSIVSVDELEEMLDTLEDEINGEDV